MELPTLTDGAITLRPKRPAEARGRGVAARAVRLLRDWAHAELGLTLIEILTAEDNVASRRVAERAGFVATGERKPSPRDPSARPHLVYASRP